jgi:hypothetical protein
MMRRLLGSTLLAATMVVATSGVGTAGAAPGNSGDVKVNGTSIDSIPNNDPHQGCQFGVEFYNFALGSPDASYSFALSAPTQSPTSNLLASGSAVIGGGPMVGFDQLDAAVMVDLTASLGVSGATPGTQGYHVKLDVTTPDMNGNGSKSKVFWVSGDCGPLPGSGGGDS